MKKCNKFKEYFIFSNDDEFQKHIEECPDCKVQNDEFEKISAVVKEVKFAYKQKQKSKLMTKVACISALMMFTFSFSLFNNLGYLKENSYSEYSQDTIIDEMGMPIDSYGLIMVD